MMNAKVVDGSYNVQLAKSYITYMMVSSYFKKATCQNKREETHLYLHYCEMPQQKQLKQEEYVVKTIEKIDRRILRKLENLQCSVSFEKVNTMYTIHFLTGFEEVIAEIDEKGMVDIRVYSKLNRKVVECVVSLEKVDGKRIVYFHTGLEELVSAMKTNDCVNVKVKLKEEKENITSMAA